MAVQLLLSNYSVHLLFVHNSVAVIGICINQGHLNGFFFLLFLYQFQNHRKCPCSFLVLNKVRSHFNL